MELVHIFQYTFIQRAFITGIFIAILCSILGMFLVLRNLSLIGDGLAHVSFGALAVGLFFGFYPVYIVIPLVVLASILILKLTEKAKLYGDAAIGVVSSFGIALGIILASISHGFNVDLLSYLFGNILSVGFEEMILTIGLSIVVIAVIYLLYHDLFFLTFSQELAQVSGIKTKKINTLLVILTAVTVALSIRVVGVMLISSLLILPAVSSLQIARGFKLAIITAVIFSVVSVITGILISFFLNLPAGATIVIINFLIFICSYFAGKSIKSK